MAKSNSDPEEINDIQWQNMKRYLPPSHLEANELMKEKLSTAFYIFCGQDADGMRSSKIWISWLY